LSSLVEFWRCLFFFWDLSELLVHRIFLCVVASSFCFWFGDAVLIFRDFALRFFWWVSVSSNKFSAFYPNICL
jgi:hypothetical protein